MTALSDNARAFRNSMEGLTRQHATRADAIEQSWRESAKEGEKGAKEASEKAQKLVERVRERAAHLRSLDSKSGLSEISVGEEPEVEDADPEVERFSQQLYTQQKRAEEAAATTAQSTSGQPVHADRAVQPPAAPQPAPEQNSRWNVQAGRFGRQNQQPTPPPAAAPTPPPAPKPEPRSRRQPSFDDDDDFENQSWLR
ncbi:hypothetical protein OU415_06495 [Saccharopolyspora sp. WRP15-2]|uniref:Uncharacterized protein n=1 Tax=Saccharopolyspora oryzae TaxID=2997343 RepID=A0ABT4UTM2_9PSEU|nr:hypothetical protein [Saccharopolyspora oryzae]MDA3625075.1 hypothetical protein [Saccharopolyspora oryzae]